MSMIEKWLACTIVVLFVSVGQLVEGFQVHPCNRVQITTALAAQPRRNLKKVSPAHQPRMGLNAARTSLIFAINLTQRRGRRMRDQQLKIDNDFPWETAESRPLVSSISKEAGEDYWIDEKEAEAARLREEAIKNRKVWIEKPCCDTQTNTMKVTD